MTLHLKPNDIARLARASETLLSPLAYPNVAAWGDAVMRDLGELVGADQLLFAVPIAGQAELRGADPRTDGAIAAYLSYYHAVDFAFNRRRRARGLEIYPAHILYEPGEQERTELYRDWCVPYRMCDALGMSVQLDEGTLPAGVHFYHDSEGKRPFGQREVELLTLLLPAFKAGVRTVRQFADSRHSVLAMLDAMPGAVAVLDTGARVLHESAALRALRARVSTPDGNACLTQVIMQVARGATCSTPRRTSPPGTPFTEARLGDVTLRLSGTRVVDPANSTPLVLVLVECKGGGWCDPAEVQARFRLTPRQLEVAVLLRDGLTNDEIAARLGISAHTAERHTEDVLRKMRLRSRGAVAARMMG